MHAAAVRNLQCRNALLTLVSLVLLTHMISTWLLIMLHVVLLGHRTFRWMFIMSRMNLAMWLWVLMMVWMMVMRMMVTCQHQPSTSSTSATIWPGLCASTRTNNVIGIPRNIIRASNITHNICNVHLNIMRAARW